ncbi:MAG: hypothetical protein PHF33_08875 [Candidatus Delongbacteria bacterium]|nr:hypothetical protein [Candidatus Delongbacteria bacterium]
MENQESPKISKPDWKIIVEEWMASGLSKSEFCRTRDINKRQFCYHSIRHGAFSRPRSSTHKASSDKIPENFAKVVCADELPSSKKTSLTILLDCGGQIKLDDDFNVELLKKVLKAVKEIC